MRTCSECGRPEGEVTFSVDPRRKQCNDCRNAKSRSRYAEDPTKRRAVNASSYRRHAKAHNARTQAYWQRIKVEVIAHYGGKCECCGEMEMVFLTIDHINGGGRQHRKETGSFLYQWLRRNGYPEGFQVLCFNCNFAKANGGCPHHAQFYVVGQQAVSAR